ncbi:copper transporter 5.1-like [Ceratina calcarata]|uniref:Copper transport protein n=1 Tax=Ceratina calcarata TaxID=156304 RepID=A0AAJ7WFE9_9HYME|nr:copper transporter 5.1-like [Ceratina calcarata]
MKMSFHIGENEIILFDEWHTMSWDGLGWSMVGIILLTSIYEGLKSYRDHLYINVTRLKKNTGNSRESFDVITKGSTVQK